MEQPIVEEKRSDSLKPRNGFVAFLLSLVLPGLGQVYNGQPRKAIIFFGLLLILPWLFGITRGTTVFFGLLSLLIIELALRIYIIIDGVINARRQKDYIPKLYNTWYYYLVISFLMVAIYWVYEIRPIVGIQTFKVQTTSNDPTFQPGDCLVADMSAYKNRMPDYGDIVIFTRPDGHMYSFRVVGRPNDNLELKDNIVTINGKSGKANFIKETNSGEMSVTEFEEELPNGHKHFIYKFKQPFDSTKSNINNILVPPNSYYLLGDNRDNAADSRYEGFVNIKRIKGRIVYSYWGQTANRINIDFRDK